MRKTGRKEKIIISNNKFIPRLRDSRCAVLTANYILTSIWDVLSNPTDTSGSKTDVHIKDYNSRVAGG